MSKRGHPTRTTKAASKVLRSSLLNIRLSTEERRMFEAQSRTLGLSLSSWARMILRREVGTHDACS